MSDQLMTKAYTALASRYAEIDYMSTLSGESNYGYRALVVLAKEGKSTFYGCIVSMAQFSQSHDRRTLKYHFLATFNAQLLGIYKEHMIGTYVGS